MDVAIDYFFRGPKGLEPLNVSRPGEHDVCGLITLSKRAQRVLECMKYPSFQHHDLFTLDRSASRPDHGFLPLLQPLAVAGSFCASCKFFSGSSLIACQFCDCNLPSLRSVGAPFRLLVSCRATPTLKSSTGQPGLHIRAGVTSLPWDQLRMLSRHLESERSSASYSVARH